MGFAISWLAFSGKSRAEVLGMLHLVDTGDEEELPESPMTAADLPRGWTLVYLNRFDHPFAEDASLRLFSKSCEIIACHIEEHVMFSSAECYRDGLPAWSVFHDAQRDMYNLETDGTLPDGYAEVRSRLIREQDEAGGKDADVDFIFDIPLELAELLCGFKHDLGSFAWGTPRFTMLKDRSAMQ
jgi:hypothetical protein